MCLLNDERYRAIEGSSRPPLINLTVPFWVSGDRGSLRTYGGSDSIGNYAAGGFSPFHNSVSF